MAKPMQRRDDLMALAKKTMEAMGVDQAIIVGVAEDGLLIGASWGKDRMHCALAGKRLDEVMNQLEKE